MARSIPVTQCPLCGSEIPDSTLMCECGYDFEQEEVTNWDIMRVFLIRRDLKWDEKVRLKLRAHKRQIKKHRGKRPRKKDAPGWTQIKTAEMIGESPAQLSRDLTLAEALDTYPELVNCKDKTEARRQLGVIKGGMPGGEVGSGFKSEDELQKYLVNNWAKTPLAGEWDIYNKYRKGKFDTGGVGIIDILAKHKTEPKWLIIELKKVEQSSDQVVGQVLRYMGWVKRNLARDAEVVGGLIISKSPDIKICYALVCTTNINYQSYILKNDKIQLTRWDIKNYHISYAIKDMTLEERMEFASQLVQMKPN